jgi:hypothetical protein
MPARDDRLPHPEWRLYLQEGREALPWNSDMFALPEAHRDRVERAAQEAVEGST